MPWNFAVPKTLAVPWRYGWGGVVFGFVESVHRATGYCNITHVGFLLKMLYRILSILSSIYHNSTSTVVDWGAQLKSPHRLWHRHGGLQRWLLGGFFGTLIFVAGAKGSSWCRMLHHYYQNMCSGCWMEDTCFFGGDSEVEVDAIFAVCWGSIRHAVTAWYVLTTAHWYCEASRVCKRCCSCHLFEEHMYRFQWCIYIYNYNYGFARMCANKSRAHFISPCILLSSVRSLCWVFAWPHLP